MCGRDSEILVYFTWWKRGELKEEGVLSPALTSQLVREAQWPKRHSYCASQRPPGASEEGGGLPPGGWAWGLGRAW